MMIGILETGHANIKSLSNTIEKIGYSIKKITTTDELTQVDKLILPGVGAFPAVIAQLNKSGMSEAIKEFSTVKPMLGICLGMQLMMESSEEHGFSKGLSLIKGTVSKLPSSLGPIPHVGWNDLLFKDDCILMNGVLSGSNAYFVHSYHCIVQEVEKIILTDFYGHKIVAGFQKDNIFGVQFHPEKSQKIGDAILSNFLKYSHA